MGSDVSLDISMDSRPYYSAEEKEADPIEQNSTYLVNIPDLEAESEQSILNSMDANVDSLKPPAIPDLELVSLPAPKMNEEDAEF